MENGESSMNKDITTLCLLLSAMIKILSSKNTILLASKFKLYLVGAILK